MENEGRESEVKTEEEGNNDFPISFHKTDFDYQT